MSYSIELTSHAQKDLKKIDKATRQRLVKQLQGLASNPYPSHKFRSLVGHHLAQYRLRVGHYRILYDVYPEDKVVLILRLGHRKDIYR